LPVERVEGTIVAKLPAPKTILPREKPIPKPKPETKWQQYAKLKGIQNKKKARKVWDDEIKDWRPTWGYQSRVNDELNEWVLEVPANADPYEDQFGKAKKAKTERVAKNELQRMRNIARASKLKVPGVGLTPTDTPSKDHLSKALALAKKSTASVGKFTDSLPKEKPVKNTGKKRKFEPNVGDMSKEKSAQLDILSKMAKAGPTVDVTKAMKQHLLEEEQQRQKANSERPKKAKSIKKSIKRKQGKDTKRGGGGKGKRRGRK
ncbi:ribosome biogenesis regulatory protein homolog, partial [Lingula anatina]|uniref:Ribosome biogenesis regulatory protein n=1 Tax=Lingula anatina TaxID=7574 RepID=A0A1S3JD32_LINAN